ncbi:unnamed protein product, partial [Adineta steineri]
ETTPDSSKVSKPSVNQQSSLSVVEEKPLASRCTLPSTNDNDNNNNNKPLIKQRHSTDTASTNSKLIPVKKPSITKTKDEDVDDDDYELNKKRRLSIKLNKDGQPRKKRQHSIESGPTRPVGRPPSKKTLLAQQYTNGVKRPFSKPPMNNNTNNMKHQKVNDTLINIQQKSSETENDNEIKLNSRSTNYYPCDHFGNQINSDAFKQEEHADEQLQQISSTDKNEETSRHRIPSSSTALRIDFYPRRPLKDTSTQSATTDQQRTFPPQTLEEFLEQEWESSSDFLLQQTMPHDVSSLLSCLYQFKSENAALQKKFDELKHRRDSLRVTNANLRRRLSDILSVNETIPPPPPPTTATTTTTTTGTAVTQVSPTPPLPPSLPPPPPLPLIPPPPSVVLPVIPPSPRKEQQQLKQQKLLAELELQQQLQQQKAISPTRRRLSTNTNNQHADSSQQAIKKSKSPRQPNPLTHQSILENQLRQSANNNLNSTKKPSSTTTTAAVVVSNTKKAPSSETELIPHLPSTSTTSSVLPTTVSSTLPYEQIDVAAYTLAKNGRTPTNPAISLELLSQILAASGGAMSSQLPQLFAPTWNISNFGYANFPGANPMSVSDESILRSYAPPTHPSLEQQPSSAKQQP